MFGAEINVYDMGISTINEWFKKKERKKEAYKGRQYAQGHIASRKRDNIKMHFNLNSKHII